MGCGGSLWSTAITRISGPSVEGIELALDAIGRERMRRAGCPADRPLGYVQPETLDRIFPDGYPGIELEHASVIETSMMLALRPELVDLSRALHDGPAQFKPYDRYPRPTDDVPPSGVLSLTDGLECRERRLAARPTWSSGMTRSFARNSELDAQHVQQPSIPAGRCGRGAALCRHRHASCGCPPSPAPKGSTSHSSAFPWDGGTTNRAGARHGPREVRSQSSLMRRVHHVSGIAPFASPISPTSAMSRSIRSTCMDALKRIEAGIGQHHRGRRHCRCPPAATI